MLIWVDLGEKQIEIGPFSCDYSGEIDKDGYACGYGEAINAYRPEIKYTGTFLDDKPNGLCKILDGINFV